MELIRRAVEDIYAVRRPTGSSQLANENNKQEESQTPWMPPNCSSVIKAIIHFHNSFTIGPSHGRERAGDQDRKDDKKNEGDVSS